MIPSIFFSERVVWSKQERQIEGYILRILRDEKIFSPRNDGLKCTTNFGILNGKVSNQKSK